VPFSGTDSEWDFLVAGLPDGTFCHLAGWGAVMRDALGHESWRWVAVDERGGLHGALPLVRVRSRLFGHYLLSMPFLSYGGPIGSMAGKQALARKAVAEAQRLDVDLLELRVRQPLQGDLPTSSRKLTVLKALPESAEDLWENGIRAKVRSQVRRPMKAGMQAHFGSDMVGPFYEVFSRTMRDLGTPVLPAAFFEAIATHLREHVVFCAVMWDGRCVAAGCGFLWNGEFEITWAGALRELSRESPNMLLYWSLMEESIRRGADTFNFGRCSPDSGTHRFKKQWGTTDHPLPWAQWSPTGLEATPNPDSPKYRMATAVWQRLPLSVANRLGPPLARSLP
jgi:serine/alanine adding enzyme